MLSVVSGLVSNSPPGLFSVLSFASPVFGTPEQVDKTMFSDLTAEMRDNLKTTLPQTPFSDEDDMIPVAAGPKVQSDWPKVE